MPTMTMQSIADVARVQRSVVSMWRTRSVHTAQPFPPSLSDSDLLFDADQIAAWLEATGKGSNPEAPREVLLHSSQLDVLKEKLEAASTLCLLHDLVGGPLAEVRDKSLPELPSSHLSDLLLPAESVREGLRREELVGAVDQLAEAAFSGRQVLGRLVASFADHHGAWAKLALTSPGVDLMAGILQELLDLMPARSGLDEAPCRLDPHGAGGVYLATELARALEDGEQPVYGIDRVSDAPASSRAAVRLLAAHAGLDHIAHRAESADEPHVAVLYEQAPPSPESYFDQIESVLVELGPSDIALVVGPSSLLLEPLPDVHSRATRTRVLLPQPDRPAPLRYAARLPKGLGRFSGRRRLALWVFGTADTRAGREWTVYGEHADTVLDAASRMAVVADVAAALAGGSALGAHAFLASARVETGALLRRGDFVLAPDGTPARNGADTLARLWEIDDGLLGEVVSVHVTQEPRTDSLIPWDAVVRAHAREITGVRLPRDAVGASSAGTVVVIGSDEVRAPARLGTRAIDRLVLEKTAPRSTLTAAGDVVFIAEGGPAAIVDTVGGHVVQAPARVLRCRPDQPEDAVLHPRVVAADIARQQGRDRSTWQLRSVPVESVPALEAVTKRLDERRAELQRRLAHLDEVQNELTHAIATGTLVATLTPARRRPDDREDN